jgi:hypothetical protein
MMQRALYIDLSRNGYSILIQDLSFEFSIDPWRSRGRILELISMAWLKGPSPPPLITLIEGNCLN